MTLADSPATFDSEPAARHRPRLADGVELIGEYEGSGYREPPSLIRRGDGQVIQLPPLLYGVAAKSDGEHDVAEIAADIGEEIHRKVDADQVQYLVDEKLRPLGVLAAADGSSPPAEKADPFLNLRFRAAVISERTSDLLGAAFAPLFAPPIVIVMLAAFVVGDVWLFFGHGVAQALRDSINHPGIFLPLFLAVVVSAGLHEIGHAAACRYGGGHPGRMGCGLYLAWPAFYTDVTDAYRLGKRARLRTDLGGVYFNIVVVLATMAAYAATRFEPLLLLVVIQHFEIVHQLLPVIRLDGYYIVADLTGVPDLFARIGPILRSLIPGRPADERVTVLKPWVRAAVTGWVLVVVPLLVFELLIVLIHLPRILGTAVDSGTSLWHRMVAAPDVLTAVTDLVQVVVLAVPIVGIILVLITTVRRITVTTWQRTQGRPIARLAAVVVGAAAAAALALAWIPAPNYRAIQPGERGTLSEGITAVRRLPSGSAPLVSERAAQRRTETTTPPISSTPSSSSTTSIAPAQSRPTTNTTVAFTPTTVASSSAGSSPATTSTPPTSASVGTTVPGQ